MSTAVTDALQKALEEAHQRLDALDGQVRGLQGQLASSIIEHFRELSGVEERHAAELRQLIAQITALASAPREDAPKNEAAEKAQLEALQTTVTTAIGQLADTMAGIAGRVTRLSEQVQAMPHPPTAIEFDVFNDGIGNTTRIIARGTK